MKRISSHYVDLSLQVDEELSTSNSPTLLEPLQPATNQTQVEEIASSVRET